MLKRVLNLEITQISGLTETACIASADDLRTMFESFRAQIAGGPRGLQSLVESSERLAGLTQTAPSYLAKAGEAVAHVRAQFA